MPNRFPRILWAAVALGGVMAFLAQTSPHVARSNLSAWYEEAAGIFGDVQAPALLATPAADTVVFWLGVALIAVAALWGLVASLAAWRRRTAGPTSPPAPFAVSFADEMPKLNAHSDYIHRYELVVNGRSSETHLYGHACLFAVKNALDVTVKDAKAVLLSITENGRRRSCEMPLPCLGRPHEHLIIHRDESVYFHLVEWIEPDPNPHWLPRHPIDAETFDFLAVAAQPNMLSPVPSVVQTMAIPLINGGMEIHPPIGNDRIQLDIAIYSENNPAVYARFKIARRERIEVKLLTSGLHLPK